MTPEEEQAVREAGPGWCSEVLWVKIWQLLDAERAKVEKLDGVIRRQVCSGHRNAVACRAVWDREMCLAADCWLTREERESLAALDATDE